MVVLGAGLDTRAYRLAVPTGSGCSKWISGQNRGQAQTDPGAGRGDAGPDRLRERRPGDRPQWTRIPLAKAGSGSRLPCTYVRRDFLDGTAMYGADALHRQFVEKDRIWRFGLNPDDVDRFLAEYGWRELEQMGSDELTARYVRPSGRSTPVSDLERTVHAEKL